PIHPPVFPPEYCWDSYKCNLRFSQLAASYAVSPAILASDCRLLHAQSAPRGTSPRSQNYFPATEIACKKPLAHFDLSHAHYLGYRGSEYARRSRKFVIPLRQHSCATRRRLRPEFLPSIRVRRALPRVPR